MKQPCLAFFTWVGMGGQFVWKKFLGSTDQDSEGLAGPESFVCVRACVSAVSCLRRETSLKSEKGLLA